MHYITACFARSDKNVAYNRESHKNWFMYTNYSKPKMISKTTNDKRKCWGKRKEKNTKKESYTEVNNYKKMK